MTWDSQPVSESQVGRSPQVDPQANLLSVAPSDSAQRTGQSLVSATRPGLIRIGKQRLVAESNSALTEVFTVTLGAETIQLLPFKNWGQLDIHKWGVQGKLPGDPAGLEVTPEHVKVCGDTVLLRDTEACAKLEKAFNQWIVLEENNRDLARKKPRSSIAPAATDDDGHAIPLHFRVEVDKRGQVHILCQRGMETLGAAGLTAQGFNALFSQGLMRKPRSLDVGALHDWVELDGVLCSFEHGNKEWEKLEKLLNEKYLPLTVTGQGKDIVVFANAASPTGFDIQFPVSVGGVLENRRRTLNDAALELLQEPNRCGLLPPGLIVKISPPNLIFKRKTADSGEAYLAKDKQNLVKIAGEDGPARFIDLSQPVNYTGLGVPEMTAVFNHPAVNCHRSSESLVVIEIPRNPPRTGNAQTSEVLTFAKSEVALRATVASADSMKASLITPVVSGTTSKKDSDAPASALSCQTVSGDTPGVRPNAWLECILNCPPIRYDWFACLLYSAIARHFSNSREGHFGMSKCWSVALSDQTDISAPDFRGLFLTQKSGIGYVGNNRLVRFHQSVMFLGTLDTAIEGIGVDLVAVGVTDRGQFVFITLDALGARFDVPAPVLSQELSLLSQAGASISTVKEVLESQTGLQLVWSVPGDQPNPGSPEAVESRP